MLIRINLTIPNKWGCELFYDTDTNKILALDPNTSEYVELDSISNDDYKLTIKIVDKLS